MDSQQADLFPWPRSCDRSFFKDPLCPLFFVLLARIPFDDVTDFLAAGQVDSSLQGVMSRIQAHEKFAGCQGVGFVHHPIQEGDKITLTVLLAFAQFEFQTPVFSTKICRNRRISVCSFICTRNAFVVWELSMGKTSQSKVTAQDVIKAYAISALGNGKGFSCR
jgi:hypothetical protein